LFFGIWGYGRERNGLLGNMLNTHPMALRHLMPALTHFYIGSSARPFVFCG
jgi:ubiquitin conjugation factor E4 B